ncbi:hypothetical protein BH09BAC6_BH09BAC6_29750 [soil metagenome]|jgi:thiol-disulfide isomerase/thioredoxin
MRSFKQFLALKKPILSRTIVFNVVFWAALLLLIFNPSAKALLIRGLMHVGLFQPDISAPLKAGNTIATAPDITFEDSDRKIIHLDDLKGKVVFINLWATWCPPCIAEMPSINELYAKLKNNKNVVFIMADVDNNLQQSGQFMTKHQLHMPLYEPVTAIPATLFGGTIPTTIIINKDGKVVFRHEGAADYSNPKMLDYLNKLSR